MTILAYQAWKEPKVRHYDLVIVGTELEGLYMAKRAHQEGLKVAIVEPMEGIGGQLLQGEMLYLDETFDLQNRSLVQGLMKDLFTRYYKGEIKKLAHFEAYVQQLIKGIPIEVGATIEKVHTNGRSVTGLSYETSKGQKRFVTLDYIVDNSDRADVIDRLGVQRMPGLEALYQTPGKEYMSGTYMMNFRNVNWQKLMDVFWKQQKNERAAQFGAETYIEDNFGYGFSNVVAKFTPSNPDMVNLRGLNILNQQDGDVIINALQVYDVDPSRPESIRRARELAKLELPRIRDLLREHLPGFEKVELGHAPKYLYVREYNHYPTEYVLQASDLLQGRMYWDNVSVGSYFMDIQGSRSNREGMAIGMPDKYGMPLRSYLLRDYDNVITTGKLVGATPFAYGSARIQPNGALAAESIGVLIAWLKGKPLKQVTKEEMKQFHVYMHDKYHVELNQKEGRNMIAGFTEAEIEELNKGHISLLGGSSRVRPFPLTRILVDDREIRFRGQRPVNINGSTWVPMEELFRALGATKVKYDLDQKKIVYELPAAAVSGAGSVVAASYSAAAGAVGGATHSMPMQAYMYNNRILVNVKQVAEELHYKLSWDGEKRVVALVSHHQLVSPVRIQDFLQEDGLHDLLYGTR